MTSIEILTQLQSDTIKEIRRFEEGMMELFNIVEGTDASQRWLSIAKTDMQKGFMGLMRAVAKPNE